LIDLLVDECKTSDWMVLLAIKMIAAFYQSQVHIMSATRDKSPSGHTSANRKRSNHTLLDGLLVDCNSSIIG